MSAREHAAAAAEAVRRLDRETLWAEAYTSPVEFDETILELGLLARRLPQALRQALEWLVEANSRGAVAHDTLGSAGATVAKVSLHLAQAATSAESMARNLDAARQFTARLQTPAVGSFPLKRSADRTAPRWMVGFEDGVLGTHGPLVMAAGSVSRSGWEGARSAMEVSEK